jgi:hypothetical protein
MKAVKILVGSVLGLVGLAVLAILLGLFLNRADRSPAPEAVAFQQLLDSRPPVAHAENAYVYQLGFDAPEGRDPGELGAWRFEWITNHSPAEEKGDPLVDSVDLRKAASESVARLDEPCRADDRAACADAFLRFTDSWEPDAQESLALRRYHVLLGYRAWREIVPTSLSDPLPSYSQVLYGQRLHHLRLLQLARRGDAQAVREGLEAESLYWRSAKAGAQTLISQMIAVAALRHHYFFGNLVLRSLPADRAATAVPEDWRREYSPAERSMRLVLAGEFAITRRTLDDFAAEATALEEDVENAWLRQAIKEKYWSFYQPQETSNGIARMLARLCDAVEVPMADYPAAERKLLDSELDSQPKFSFYNPLGTFLLRANDIETYLRYAYRVASTEGMRRASLLVVELRAAGVDPAQRADRVASATLLDPYTGAAFEWDEGRQSIVFIGREEHNWRRHEYFY